MVTSRPSMSCSRLCQSSFTPTQSWSSICLIHSLKIKRLVSSHRLMLYMILVPVIHVPLDIQLVMEVRFSQLLVVQVYANAYLEPMPLEECGNMIIMALAYAQRTSDTAYLSQHYPILKQWTGYLVAEALIPANQLSTDDFQGTLANQTNLALKGIIAIEAMSVVAKLTGNTADATNYTNIA